MVCAIDCDNFSSVAMPDELFLPKKIPTDVSPVSDEYVVVPDTS